MTPPFDPFLDRATLEADRRGGLYQRFALRALSIPLSRLSLKLGLTPIQATLSGALFGMAAALIAVVGGPAWLVPAGVALHLAKVMDFVDGNLARALRAKTYAGKMLDGLTDVFLDGLFLVAVGIALGGRPAVLASVAAWISCVGAFARFRYVQFHDAAFPPGREFAGSASPARPVSAGIVGRFMLALERLDRELYLPSLLVLVALGRADLWLYAIVLLRTIQGVLNGVGLAYLGALRLAIPRR